MKSKKPMIFERERHIKKYNLEDYNILLEPMSDPEDLLPNQAHSTPYTR
jgi:hypothetical protein